MTDPRPPRRSRRRALLLRAALACALLVPWVVGEPAGGALENRTTAQFPSLSFASVLDAGTYRQIDAALLDRLGLRGPVTDHVGREGLEHLGTSMNALVVAGTDGELFLADDLTTPCRFQDRFDIAATKRRITAWSRTAAAHGRRLLVTIAPSKTVIRRDRLANQPASLTRCSDDVRRKVRAAWGPNGDATVLLLWDELARVDRVSGGRAYQPGDSHWTSLGATVLLRRLVTHLAGRTVDVELTPTHSWDRPGELYRQLGFHRTDPVPAIPPGRAGVTTERSVTPTGSGRGLRRYVSTSTTQPLVPGRTLVVHDSFANALEPLAAPYFRDISFLHWTDFIELARAGRPLPAFDRLVIETSEGGFSQKAVEFLADPQVDRTIVAALSR